MTKRLISLCVVLLMPMLCVSAGAEDLCQQFGTKSTDAAAHIDQAITLSEQKKHVEALGEIDIAIRFDNRCVMAHYWRGEILRDLGRIDEALKAFEVCYELGLPALNSVSLNAALGAGLIHGKLGNYSESTVWFTRVIMGDPGNQLGWRGRAWRNTAVSCERDGRRLAAAIAAVIASEDDTSEAHMKMVRDLSERVEDKDEAASLLIFPAEKRPLPAREAAGPLVPATPEGEVAGKVERFLVDPEHGTLVALSSEASTYYVIETTPKLFIRKVDIPARATAAALASGRLYLVYGEPRMLAELEPATGKVLRSFDVSKVGFFETMAPVPSMGRLYFPAGGFLQLLDLESGAITQTKTPAHVVTVDPSQKFLFVGVTDSEYLPHNGDIVIGGRPVSFPRYSDSGLEWHQMALVRYAITFGRLVLADIRINAASNARSIIVSPDGRWVTAAGGGGWRPVERSSGAGYGFAIFDANRLETVRAFLGTNGYPSTIAFNPVTAQVVATHGDDVFLYQLQDGAKGCRLNDKGTPAFDKIPGPCTGLVAWTPSGDYLVLADPKAGVRIFANPLNEAEKKFASTWWIGLAPEARGAVSAGAKPAADPPANPVFASFGVKTTREEAVLALRTATASVAEKRPRGWKTLAMYAEPASVRKALEGIEPLLEGNTGDEGIAVFLLRNVLKEHPDFVPAKSMLGQALRRTGQKDEALRVLTECVCADAGRSDVSLVALNEMASIFSGDKKTWAAVYCLASSLRLDTANPETIDQLVPMLEANALVAEARACQSRVATTDRVSTKLPPLPLLAPGAVALTPEALYAKAVPSVVLVKSSRCTGTGFCVGASGIVLTNDHVTASSGIVEVTLFRMEAGKPVKLPPMSARVLYASADTDIAVLRITNPPASLVPLPLVMANPSAGEKVFAIGNPGLGDRILEQSISDGIVSSNSRTIGKNLYLQHTAAVNPGNSGGPLLNDKGQVVGMITLKAELEGVSFAIPAEVLRSIFPKK